MLNIRGHIFFFRRIVTRELRELRENWKPALDHTLIREVPNISWLQGVILGVIIFRRVRSANTRIWRWR